MRACASRALSRGLRARADRAARLSRRVGRPRGRAHAFGRRRSLPRVHPLLARLERAPAVRARHGAAAYLAARRDSRRHAPVAQKPPRPGTSPSPELPAGGEHAGLARLKRWLPRGLAEYEERHDDLAADRTSHLSPYLHFGCLSASHRARARRKPPRTGPREAFARQLCWRDFHHQVLAARPDLPHADYRPRGDRWRRGKRLAEAWREGQTGYPIVDAGMRQLAREGFMHNRARLIVASFLTKLLYIDWRIGAAHFAGCSSTPTSPTTSATGSGSPAPATTRGRTACSTRSARLTASTRPANTCAATCPSSPLSTGARSTSPGAVHCRATRPRLSAAHGRPHRRRGGAASAARMNPRRPRVRLHIRAGDRRWRRTACRARLLAGRSHRGRCLSCGVRVAPSFHASLDDGEAVLRFPFDERLRQLLRAMPGRRWDPAERAWRVPLDPERAEALTRLFGGPRGRARDHRGARARARAPARAAPPRRVRARPRAPRRVLVVQLRHRHHLATSSRRCSSIPAATACRRSAAR